jgi:hypothetical protein
MTEEMIKLLVGLGVGGVVGGIALWQLAGFRREHRADLAALRDELHDSLVNLPGQLAAIHSRLGGLGADSIAPPVAVARVRRGKLPRIQTAPAGYPAIPEPIEEDK